MLVGRGSTNGILVFGTDGKLKGQLAASNKPVAELEVNALAVDETGTIFALSDSADKPIVILDRDGQIKATIGDNSLGRLGFQSPLAIAVDKGGNLIVADESRARVQRWNPVDNTVRAGDPLPDTN